FDVLAQLLLPELLDDRRRERRERLRLGPDESRIDERRQEHAIVVVLVKGDEVGQLARGAFREHREKPARIFVTDVCRLRGSSSTTDRGTRRTAAAPKVKGSCLRPKPPFKSRNPRSRRSRSSGSRSRTRSSSSATPRAA